MRVFCSTDKQSSSTTIWRCGPDAPRSCARCFATGALEAGPWYVLADELIPSGEALVRNLLAGRRVLERLWRDGAARALLSGFVRSSRGAAGDRRRLRSPADRALARLRWAALAGGRHRALDRAERRIGAGLSSAARRVRVRLASARRRRRAAERWAKMRGELAPRATTGDVLVTHGADHHARQVAFRRRDAALETAVDAAGNGDRLRASSLERICAGDWWSERRRRRRASGHSRRAARFVRLHVGLQGTFATRAHEKRPQRAHRAFADSRDGAVDSVRTAAGGARRARRSLVRDAAWRDAASRAPARHAMWLLHRRRRARDGTPSPLGRRSGNGPSRRCDSAIAWPRSRRRRATRAIAGQPISVVRNPVARPRSGVAIVDVEQWLADVPVGPGSAGGTSRRPRRRSRVTRVRATSWRTRRGPGAVHRVASIL